MQQYKKLWQNLSQGSQLSFNNWSYLINIKKEVKKNPIFKEIRKLSTEAVSALSHEIYTSCQQRKDLIKNDIDEKFHSLCEASHAVSATNLFGDNLNTKLKELDDTKKVSVSKRKNYYMKQDRKRKFDRHDNRYQEDFRWGYSKNHKPYNRTRKKTTRGNGRRSATSNPLCK